MKAKTLSTWLGATRCAYCDTALSFKGPQTPRTATVDHIVPRAAGGSNEVWNLTLACYRCNQRKSDNPR